MPKEINITIENKFVRGKRDMNIYHHSTRSARMINHNDSITFPLRPVLEDDYLYISPVGGPGHLENKSVVNLPSWTDFEFWFEGNIALIHSGDRTILKIPPGIIVWQLKVTRAPSFIPQLWDRVVIGDDQSGYR
jgi:hypothetical protein